MNDYKLLKQALAKKKNISIDCKQLVSTEVNE